MPTLVQAWSAQFAGSLRQLRSTAARDQAAAQTKNATTAGVWSYMGACRPSPMPLDAFGPAGNWKDRLVREFEPRSFLMSRAEILGNPMMRQMYEPMSDGHQIVRQMNLDIDAFSPQPTDFQRMLIGFTIELSAPRIYGREWRTHQLSIKRVNGWTESYHGIGAVMTGRKEGKSTGLAMVTTIALFNLASAKIALFSKTLQQARIILGMAKELAQNHGRTAEFKIETNADQIKVTHLATGNVRLCTAYSGSADVSCLFVFVKRGCHPFVCCLFCKK